MLGKYLVILGILIAGIGLLLTIAPKIPFLGKLPGDFYYRKDGSVFYFPLASSIILSIILTLILNLILRR